MRSGSLAIRCVKLFRPLNSPTMQVAHRDCNRWEFHYQRRNVRLSSYLCFPHRCYQRRTYISRQRTRRLAQPCGTLFSNTSPCPFSGSHRSSRFFPDRSQLYSPWFVGSFNDVKTGSNPGCGTPGFPTAPGWDPVTGLGTPNFRRLLQNFLWLP